MVLMGPLCGIYDLPAITRANYRANELGLDTMSYGGTLACAMELAGARAHPPRRDRRPRSRLRQRGGPRSAGGDDGAPGRARRRAGRGRLPPGRRPRPARDRHDGQEARDPGLRPAGLLHPGPRLHDLAERRLPPPRRLRRLPGLLRRGQGDPAVQPAAVADRHPQHAEHRHPPGQPRRLPLHRLRLRRRPLGPDDQRRDRPRLLRRPARRDREPRSPRSNGSSTSRPGSRRRTTPCPTASPTSPSSSKARSGPSRAGTRSA
ncbi:MAG: aldehyde ferredoxin oxidoreductase C-terminal domain-containing protein [Candidatus Moduliflexus flocculans]|nr:aldehyde ferredoxin oxidoreductase C-terminal domain-containing protein [Candidatus Moduliflexus flocculans]